MKYFITVNYIVFLAILGYLFFPSLSDYYLLKLDVLQVILLDKNPIYFFSHYSLAINEQYRLQSFYFMIMEISQWKFIRDIIFLCWSFFLFLYAILNIPMLFFFLRTIWNKFPYKIVKK